MELPREYDSWRKRSAAIIAPEKCSMTPEPLQEVRKKVQFAIERHIDRLWYESALDVLKTANVYENGGNRRIPRLYTANNN
jgi:hypothetical protein